MRCCRPDVSSSNPRRPLPEQGKVLLICHASAQCSRDHRDKLICSRQIWANFSPSCFANTEWGINRFIEGLDYLDLAGSDVNESQFAIANAHGYERSSGHLSFGCAQVIRGFWVKLWLEAKPKEEQEAIVQEVLNALGNKVITTYPGRIFPLKQARSFPQKRVCIATEPAIRPGYIRKLPGQYVLPPAL